MQMEVTQILLRSAGVVTAVTGKLQASAKVKMNVDDLTFLILINKDGFGL